MKTLLRRWFGLRCLLNCCPCRIDRQHEWPPNVLRCTDCGDVRDIIA